MEPTRNPTIYPPCGRLCDAETCEGKRLYNKTNGKEGCGGCLEAKGSPVGCINSEHPEKYQNITICPIYKCALEHKVEHCGLCPEFPCETFTSWYDPKSGHLSTLSYIRLLLVRKDLGIREWIRQLKIFKKNK